MGEQQALAMVGRVARTRWREGTIMLDEPDAFLHPRLAGSHVWRAADIEGVMLSSSEFISEALRGRLFRPEWDSVDKIQGHLRELLAGQRDGVIAELVINSLDRTVRVPWPNTTGNRILERLRRMEGHPRSLGADEIESAIATAESTWEQTPDKFQIVRAKRISQGLNAMTIVARADAFFTLAAARKPNISDVRELEALVRRHSLTF